MVEQPVDGLVEKLDQAGRRLGFASTMRNEAAAKLVGLHPTDWLALDLLDAIGPTPIGALGRDLGLSRSAATSLVDRLERERLVTRRATEDRRVFEVVPLATRTVHYNDLDQDLRRRMADHATAFSRRDLETVLRFMRGTSEILIETAEQMRNHSAQSQRRSR